MAPIITAIAVLWTYGSSGQGPAFLEDIAKDMANFHEEYEGRFNSVGHRHAKSEKKITGIRLPFGLNPPALSLLMSHLPIVSAGDSGDDFSNNLFSDLAPILALFGEQVAKQYLSHSMSWLESFIFAMGPLGIITAVVAAIRVSGPTSLKAIIGRARDGIGMVELELMSSTSADVCELWNGSSFSRVLGSNEPASVVEILHIKNTTGVENTTGKAIHSTGLYDFETAVEAGLLKPLKSRGGNAGAGLSAGRALFNPPNLGMNFCGSGNKTKELYAVAFIGVFLQAGVIFFAGFSVLDFDLREKLKKQDRYVEAQMFALMVIGTVLLTLGMFLCAHIIERSTREEVWVYTPASTEGKAAEFIWLQQTAVVSDQEFNPYILKERRSARQDETNYKAFTQNKIPEFKGGHPYYQIILRKSGFGRVLQARKVALKYKRKLSRLGFSKPVTYRTDLSLTRSYRSEKAMRRMSFLTTIATATSTAGFVIQFIGLRGLHWSVAIAQLATTVAMAAFRALVQRGLAPDSVESVAIPRGFELESSAKKLAKVQHWNISTVQPVVEIVIRDELRAEFEDIYNSTNAKGSEGWKLQRRKPAFLYSHSRFNCRGARALLYAERLKQLTKWQSPHAQVSASLATAMEICLNFLTEHATESFASFANVQKLNTTNSKFSWILCMESTGESKGKYTMDSFPFGRSPVLESSEKNSVKTEYLTFTATRMLRAGENGSEWSPWTISREEKQRLELVLTLWLAELELLRSEPACSSKCKVLRMVSSSSFDRYAFCQWLPEKGRSPHLLSTFAGGFDSFSKLPEGTIAPGSEGSSQEGLCDDDFIIAGFPLKGWNAISSEYDGTQAYGDRVERRECINEPLNFLLCHIESPIEKLCGQILLAEFIKCFTMRFMTAYGGRGNGFLQLHFEETTRTYPTVAAKGCRDPLFDRLSERLAVETGLGTTDELLLSLIVPVHTEFIRNFRRVPLLRDLVDIDQVFLSCPREIRRLVFDYKFFESELHLVWILDAAACKAQDLLDLAYGQRSRLYSTSFEETAINAFLLMVRLAYFTAEITAADGSFSQKPFYRYSNEYTEQIDAWLLFFCKQLCIQNYLFIHHESVYASSMGSIGTLMPEVDILASLALLERAFDAWHERFKQDFPRSDGTHNYVAAWATNKLKEIKTFLLRWQDETEDYLFNTKLHNLSQPRQFGKGTTPVPQKSQNHTSKTLPTDGDCSTKSKWNRPTSCQETCQCLILVRVEYPDLKDKVSYWQRKCRVSVGRTAYREMQDLCTYQNGLELHLLTLLPALFNRKLDYGETHKINITDVQGRTPIMLACRAGNSAALSLLLKYLGKIMPICLSRADSAGQNVLHHAVIGNSLHTLHLLLTFMSRNVLNTAERMKIVLRCDNNGTTALDIALALGRPIVVGMLLFYESQDRSGQAEAMIRESARLSSVWAVRKDVGSSYSKELAKAIVGSAHRGTIFGMQRLVSLFRFGESFDRGLIVEPMETVLGMADIQRQLIVASKGSGSSNRFLFTLALTTGVDVVRLLRAMESSDSFHVHPYSQWQVIEAYRRALEDCTGTLLLELAVEYDLRASLEALVYDLDATILFTASTDHLDEKSQSTVHLLVLAANCNHKRLEYLRYPQHVDGISESLCSNKPSLVQILLAKGCRSGIREAMYSAASHEYSCIEHSHSILKMLLEASKTPKPRSSRKGSVSASNEAMMIEIAIEAGNQPIFTRLIANVQEDIWAVNRNGRSLLHLAISHGQEDTTECLLQLYSQKLDVNAQDNHGLTALHLAASIGASRTVAMLCNTPGIRLDLEDGQGRNALQWAVARGRAESVSQLLLFTDWTDTIRSKSEHNGGTLLHAAAFKGDSAVLKSFLDMSKRDFLRLALGEIDNDGCTPLHLAAGEGHLDCVRMLVESFPESVKIQDSYGCTVMNLAASKGHIHTVRFLLEQCGVDVDECGSDGQTSLHLAASSGGPGCIFLVQMLASIFGANIEAVAKDGKTPLLRAASVGALESVKFLVEMQHANVDVRDHHGWTALELARSGKHGAVVELLSEALRRKGEGYFARYEQLTGV